MQHATVANNSADGQHTASSPAAGNPAGRRITNDPTRTERSTAAETQSAPTLTPAAGLFGDFRSLPRARLAAMRAAGRDLYAVLNRMAAEGRHPVNDVLAAEPAFTYAAPMPSHAVQDQVGGGAWYYHSHDPAENQWEEHGHFHCFGSVRLIDKSACALARPTDEREPHYVHISALSIDTRGVPIKLFSVNRWMTDEWLYQPADVAALAGCFDASGAQSFADTSLWLSAMLRLFQPQIAWLLAERARVTANGAESENRAIGVTAVLDIDIDAQLANLDAAWRARRKSLNLG